MSKSQIIFKYLFAEDYNPVYVNGAHGGVSPRGEIVTHFYLERSGVPASITHEVDGGAIGSEIAQVPADFGQTLYRAVEAGIVMNYDSARSFHQWLGERLKELEALHEAREEAKLRSGGAAAN
ncbi:hypothetical protein KI809_17775 [Geobacter pelophilus]|uniref:Uncharacterized protein n=1 Tax=Geoanaerobacter pelophilus TaxID=60036 RepID=A0AAW4L5V0_9BACT|nr:hypothetical protein [Geoanaerobacter pelophilus]MBT0666164.1 hypothetical protein [Geoanaerobacter pelophilus]